MQDWTPLHPILRRLPILQALFGQVHLVLESELSNAAFLRLLLNLEGKNRLNFGNSSRALLSFGYF